MEALAAFTDINEVASAALMTALLLITLLHDTMDYVQ
jgi:hypothetical protein